MKTLLPLIGASMVLLGCVQERAGVAINELPGPVLAAFEKNARPGQIRSVIRERREQQLTYIATVTNEGREWEVGVSGDGEFLYKKEK